MHDPLKKGSSKEMPELKAMRDLKKAEDNPKKNCHEVDEKKDRPSIDPISDNPAYKTAEECANPFESCGNSDPEGGIGQLQDGPPLNHRFKRTSQRAKEKISPEPPVSLMLEHDNKR